tara:strand:- start:311 stop:1147 length:837 start_codon:yes stop_codon:yes gene_type:complete
MITIHLMGGLGNQLFQIFHLINYCLEYKVPFYFEHQKQLRYDRPFYWNNFLKSLQLFVKDAVPNLPLYRESGFHYNPVKSYDSMNNAFKFYGYYQSYKYFNKHEENIFKLIKLDEQQKEIYTKYKDIYDFENSISLHFRLGDYKNIGPNYHPIVTEEYYEKALNKIIDITGNEKQNIIYFFEQKDLSIINNKIKYLETKFTQMKFIPIDTKIADYEQLLLMSLCKHNIIANSTFSWWGAYFNRNPLKNVVHPAVDSWFGPNLKKNQTHDLCPKTWIEM